MKTVFANQQCAHVWAQQKQEEGRSGNGNLYFRGATIYSYRDSWPLAALPASGYHLTGVKTMSKYNGHPSHRLWNLALWFGNDEGLYNLARGEIRRAKNRDEAARRIFDSLQECGLLETPDGCRYSISGIRYAIRGL